MKTKKLVLLSLLTASALSLAFVETLIPNPFPIPGSKLGLANIIILLTLYRLPIKDSFIIMFLRVLLQGFLFAGFSGTLYSLAGALTSFFIMAILVHYKINVIFTSIIGGITHNLAQVVLASIVTQTLSLIYSYGPFLILFGILSGLFNGLVAYFLLKNKTIKELFLERIH